MNKPNNYDNTQAAGDFTPVELGGHYMVIKQVEEMKSKKGQDMVKIMFDFASNDNQAGFFMDSFKKDTRKDKKWSNQATQYVLVKDQDGNTSRNFKGFCTSCENSNNFTINWDAPDWAAQFKEKKIGGIFGEEMDYYDGKVRHKRILRWFCAIDKVKDATIPDVTQSKAYKDAFSNQPTTDADGFMTIPDEIDEELPFK